MHAVTSFFIENPSFFQRGFSMKKARVLDEKAKVFDEKHGFLMKNAGGFDKKTVVFDKNSCGF